MSKYDSRTRKLSFLGFKARDGNKNDPNEELLDTEMEKVFSGKTSLGTSIGNSSKMDLKKFEALKFDEADEPGINGTDPDSGGGGSSKSFEQQRILNSADNDNDSTDDRIYIMDRYYDDVPDDSPLVSKRAEIMREHSDTSGDDRHVQFIKNTSPMLSSEGGEDEDHQRKRRKSRHQYYRQRKYSHQESAPKLKEELITSESLRKISVQPEDFDLEEADINELTSHRSDDPRAFRRPKLHHISLKKQPQSFLNPKKNFDHSPHEIFVQLDELFGAGTDREWKETARWIKYEEHVLEGSDRWGRPHVASLSFHSLINLRKCLETGVVLLDLEEKDLPAVAYRVVEQMVVEDLLEADNKPTVMRALLLKHRHVNEHSYSHGFSFHKKKNSSYTSLQGLNMHHINDDKKPKILPANEINGNSSTKSHNHKLETRIDMKDELLAYSSSQEDLKKLQNESILRRIPRGAEATTVLVGSVDFLEKPTIAFIRLAEGIFMPSITEVPIPVRFMFILMGPKLIDLDYHEVGRSIATLMANEHFHDIAYKADDRKELLFAINEFLDDSLVLPPGNWDRHDLLPFEELKARKDWIRSRKTKALQKLNAEKIFINEEKSTKSLLPSEPSDFNTVIKPPRKGPLERTHRFWGGLRNDIKRRFPLYKSDILDGLNTETLAASIFMYFASLSTAITFGGLISEKTHNLIGISETLLATSIVGIIFHLIAGQPLVIMGTTGPLLLFDVALFDFCREQSLNFLTVRAYVGMWLVFIGLLVSAFEGSSYVRFLTRFTQEIFSALITLIYIFETIMKLVEIYGKHPFLDTYTDPIIFNPVTTPVENFYNGTNITSAENATISERILAIEEATVVSDIRNQPNTALFSTVLTLGTFAVAYYLKMFRNSHFLGRTARRALGDFGVPIAIAIFVMFDYFVQHVYTEKLTVPEGLSPSTPGREWLVPLGPVPIWLPFLAVVPAMLVYILIFMETHISELIVDKPERGLKKGSGLHLDIVLLSFLNALCGSLGMPWHCAATVRSVAHVSAVTIMSRTHAPGESPKIIDVKEQRLSGFFVSLMVGLSVTMTPLLRLIPMPVLFGVFFYMGIASMSGVQFFERLILYFMPTKYHPPTPYVKWVPTWKMHAFTGLQATCLAILWSVKSSIISLAFPFFLILMIPMRMKLTMFYSKKELDALDGNQTIDIEDEPDFYEQATAL